MKINKIYEREETKKEMQNFFLDEGFIQFKDFLNLDEMENFLKSPKDISNFLNKNLFIKKYIPDKYSYKEYNFNGEFNLEILKLLEFFKSKNFIKYLEEISDFDLIFKSINLRMYEKGDYTLLHDEELRNDDYLELIYDLSDELEDDEGGILTYVTKFEEVFYLSSFFNSLTIVYRSSDLMSYLKYMNHKSKNKKIIRFEIKYDFLELDE